VKYLFSETWDGRRPFVGFPDLHPASFISFLGRARTLFHPPPFVQPVRRRKWTVSLSLARTTVSFCGVFVILTPMADPSYSSPSQDGLRKRRTSPFSAFSFLFCQDSIQQRSPLLRSNFLISLVTDSANDFVSCLPFFTNIAGPRIDWSRRRNSWSVSPLIFLRFGCPFNEVSCKSFL